MNFLTKKISNKDSEVFVDENNVKKCTDFLPVYQKIKTKNQTKLRAFFTVDCHFGKF